MTRIFASLLLAALLALASTPARAGADADLAAALTSARATLATNPAAAADAAILLVASDDRFTVDAKASLAPDAARILVDAAVALSARGDHEAASRAADAAASLGVLDEPQREQAAGVIVAAGRAETDAAESLGLARRALEIAPELPAAKAFNRERGVNWLLPPALAVVVLGVTVQASILALPFTGVEVPVESQGLVVIGILATGSAIVAAGVGLGSLGQPPAPVLPAHLPALP